MPVRNHQVEGEALGHVYGPVLSRRHGWSLGINVGFENEKVCTWSCLYCQCGFGKRAQPEELSPSRVAVPVILEKVKEALSLNDQIKVITLAGNTEPGAYPDILPLIKGLIKLRVMSRGKWKVIILSNGSELDREEVCAAFDLADEAWIKLDVGLENLFQKLNRPLAKVGTVREHLERIKKLKKIRIQTLLWTAEKPELSNFTEENLASLLKLYEELGPIEIHVETIAREPAMAGLLPIAQEELDCFRGKLQLKMKKE